MEIEQVWLCETHCRSSHMHFENIIILNLFLSYFNSIFFCIIKGEENKSDSCFHQGSLYLFFLLVTQTNSPPCPLVKLPGKTLYFEWCVSVLWGIPCRFKRTKKNYFQHGNQVTQNDVSLRKKIWNSILKKIVVKKTLPIYNQCSLFLNNFFSRRKETLQILKRLWRMKSKLFDRAHAPLAATPFQWGSNISTFSSCLGNPWIWIPLAVYKHL